MSDTSSASDPDHVASIVEGVAAINLNEDDIAQQLEGFSNFNVLESLWIGAVALASGELTDNYGPHYVAQVTALLKKKIVGEPSTVPRILTELFWKDGNTNHPWPIRNTDVLNDLVRGNNLVSFLIGACDRSSHITDETEAVMREKLAEAFKQPYHGDAVDWFEQGLTEYVNMYDPGQHYGRVIPMLQSSACGKTRTIFELMKRRAVGYVCFREDDNAETGWPPRDEAACTFFRRSRDQGRIFKGEELGAAFLGALFKVVADSISAAGPSQKSSEFLKAWDLPRNGDTSRAELFKHIAEVAEESLSSALNHFHIKGETTDSQQTLLTVRAKYSKEVEMWHTRLYENFCEESGNKLMEALGERGHRGFILALDECNGLGRNARDTQGNPITAPVDYMTLVAMQRIMKTGDTIHARIWYILLDTTSTIFDIAPRKGPMAPSGRLWKMLRPLPPWPFLGFDQMVRQEYESQIPTPLYALTFRHIRMYGRPYWSTLRDLVLLDAATRKLLRSDTFEPSNVHQVLAIWSNRLLLELANSEGSTRLKIEGVRSHLRILQGVIDWNILVTAVPSEPALAAAAAHQLCLNRESYTKALDTLMRELILQGLIINTGEKGELACRLLWLMARDAAVMEKVKKSAKTEHKATADHAPVTEDEGVNMNRGYSWSYKDKGLGPGIPFVTLTELLTQLFSKSVERAGTSGKAGERLAGTSDKLAEYGDNAYVNFTHFIQLSDIIHEITPQLLYYFWCRNVAVQCASNQPVIDGFFVTYNGPLDQPFDPKYLSYVAWQSKARTKAAKSTLPKHLTGPFIKSEEGPDAKRTKPEHVVVLMDLCSRSHIGNTNKYWKITYGRAVRPSNPKTSDEDVEVRRSAKKAKATVAKDEVEVPQSSKKTKATAAKDGGKVRQPAKKAKAAVAKEKDEHVEDPNDVELSPTAAAEAVRSWKGYAQEDAGETEPERFCLNIRGLQDYNVISHFVPDGRPLLHPLFEQPLGGVPPEFSKVATKVDNQLADITRVTGPDDENWFGNLLKAKT